MRHRQGMDLCLIKFEISSMWVSRLKAGFNVILILRRGQSTLNYRSGHQGSGVSRMLECLVIRYRLYIILNCLASLIIPTPRAELYAHSACNRTQEFGKQSQSLTAFHGPFSVAVTPRSECFTGVTDVRKFRTRRVEREL